MPLPPPVLKALRNRDAYAGFVVTGCGAGVTLASLEHPLGRAGQPGPGWWPLLLGVALAALGAAVAVNGVARPAGRPSGDTPVPGRWWRVVFTGAILVGFVVLWPRIGWVPAGTLAFGLVTRLAGGTWVTSFVWAAVASSALYGLFGLVLGIPL